MAVRGAAAYSLCWLLYVSALDIELVNRTPLQLQVKSVDPISHKATGTLCSLNSAGSSCRVSTDFVVSNALGHERGDNWDQWDGASWSTATGSYDIVLDPAHPTYLKYQQATPAADTCKGSVPKPVPFYVPSQGDATDIIQHVPLPFKNNGFTIDSGKQRGTLQFANEPWLRELDSLAKPFGRGTVKEENGLPDSKTGGWNTRTTSFHENFNKGLATDRFGILLQKQSKAENVNIVKSVVDGVEQNVVRLTAQSVGDGTVLSAATIATAELFASGRYEIKAKFPAVKGLVLAMWTYHYEKHYEPDHLPPGQADSQFQPNVTGWVSRLNHEIDIEIPASCNSMCGKDTLGCAGQFDTMNLNNYIVTNNDGSGPGYNNMCARAPSGSNFVDPDPSTAEYHTYAFEWHTGGPGCKPRVDYFFDNKYVATNDVFVPSRGSRFNIGIWPGKWAGATDWKGSVHADIAEVHICPFNEPNDANYPQIYDQPFNYKERWQSKKIDPAMWGQPAASDTCAGPDSCAGSSDRANGCSCSDRDKACASGCCDYKAVPGVTVGTCAALNVCTAQCTTGTDRPYDCVCNTDQQCGTGCCSNGKCETKDKCERPCGKTAGRPDGCNCGLAGQCESGCCDYNAVPGLTNGTCATKSICASECISKSNKPIGCTCGSDELCQTKCCSSNVCSSADVCPSPSKCTEDEDKPFGCACLHSDQCASNWCSGIPAVCKPH